MKQLTPKLSHAGLVAPLANGARNRIGSSVLLGRFLFLEIVLEKPKRLGFYLLMTPTKHLVQLGRKFFAVENLAAEIANDRFDGATVYDMTGTRPVGNIEGSKFLPFARLPIGQHDACEWLA